jgi:hypothetical protein
MADVDYTNGLNKSELDAARIGLTLGERFPELRELRDRLLARVIDFDDLPEAWGRLLLDLPSDTPAWSRTDALLVEAA